MPLGLRFGEPSSLLFIHRLAESHFHSSVIVGSLMQARPEVKGGETVLVMVFKIYILALFFININWQTLCDAFKATVANMLTT